MALIASVTVFLTKGYYSPHRSGIPKEVSMDLAILSVSKTNGNDRYEIWNTAKKAQNQGA
ncbi:hypothetical protein [Spirosoma panaciterrae]|uniref:hypothetical protein n=1 Tax=Spirosoma panaciterrae TaxID=496058 RepID=UPI000365020B|nr:hypothetical protein [Spirosoma panaciterrae]